MICDQTIAQTIQGIKDNLTIGLLALPQGADPHRVMGILMYTQMFWQKIDIYMMYRRYMYH